ncbi:MAG: HNH endonuclease [Anaerolineae bacterium]|nr:HNH endonuclease [Anaerolineae bacterium]
MRSYAELRQILELWEQGGSKKSISNKLGIPRATVRDCIYRYGSVANLEAVMLGEIPKPPDVVSPRLQPRKLVAVFKPRERRYNEEDLKQAIATSLSMADVLRKLNIRVAGGNYDMLQRRIEELNLDTSHFTGSAWLRGRENPFVRQRALEEILVENSTYVSSNNLRKRLIAEGIFEHRCVSCGLDTWLDNKIPLEIDHINGDRRDNRLENLRLLCPNCHALTSTYRGKNKKATTL